MSWLLVLLGLLLGSAACGCGDPGDDDTFREPPTPTSDLDRDGWTVAEGDCDDHDASLNLDDADADGSTTCDGDCDDAAPLVSPAAAELCADGLDNDCDGVVDGGDCLTCTSRVPGGHASVEAAVADSTDGDVICVEPGTYPTELGYGGKAVTVVGVGGTPLTVLDGGGLATVVKFIEGEGPGSVLQGFTVTGGRAGAGGGLKARGASPTLRSLVVVDNGADDLGGGLYLEDSAAVIEGVVVRDNTSGGEGGGCHTYHSTASFRDVTFERNEAGGDGGGLSLRESTVTLERVDMTRNVSHRAGGGLAAIESTVVATRGAIESNDCGETWNPWFLCPGGGIYLASSIAELSHLDVRFDVSRGVGGGGGVAARDSSLRMTQVVVDRCRAMDDGGGLAIAGGALSLSHARIVGNRASSADKIGDGGGIHLVASEAELSHVVVADNEADYEGLWWFSQGGGIAIVDAAPRLDHVVVVGNVAQKGAGIRMRRSSPTLTHVIVARNGTVMIGGSSLHCDRESAPAFAYSDFVPAPDDKPCPGAAAFSDGPGNVSVDPGFLDATEPGAAGVWDLHLAADSPLIDAGDPAAADPNRSRADIGAYGGPGAGDWDLDHDGFPSWWLPGPYDPATSPGMDCDDLDASVFPGNGC